MHPRGLNPWFAAKSSEALSCEKCRQPRRGGTGGEELRRLRWSSPPGQGEPAPAGFSPPVGTTAAGQAGGKEGKPPLRTPQWHGQPSTSRTSPRRAREAHPGAMLYPKPKEACRKLQQASFRKRITPCRRCLRLRPERGDRPRPRCTQTSVRSWGSGDSPDQWKNQS